MSRSWFSGNRGGRAVDRNITAGRGLWIGRGSGPIRNTANPRAGHSQFGRGRSPYATSATRYDESISQSRNDQLHLRWGYQHDSCPPRERWNENNRPSTALQKCSSNALPGNRTFRNRTVVTSSVDFYRVTLYRCKLYEKVMLYTFISDELDKPSSTPAAKTVFIPFAARLTGSNWEFFVNDYTIAQRISDLTEKIILPDGAKMVITVKPAHPAFEMNELTYQGIILALTNLYNCNAKDADLSKFQNNDVFVSREMICSLHLNSVIVYVTDVLMKIAPDLVILNLNGNSLAHLEELGNALPRFRSLKVLRLAENKIRNVKELNHLSALMLEELNLLGNGLERLFKSRIDFVSEVRRIFPALKILDGEVLPKPIDFDLGETHMGKLPGWRLCYVDQEQLHILRGFIELYFKLYDEPGRLNLIDAYHPEAVMSLVNQGDVKEGFSVSLVSAYQPYNRNLLMPGMRETKKSDHFLHRGPNAILAVLRKLPPTQHLPETFACDMLQLGDSVYQICVTGVFKEFGNKPNVSGKPVKSFSRCFLIIPYGEAYKIINDSIVIRYPTHSQATTAKNIEIRRNVHMPSLLAKPIVTSSMEVDESSIVDGMQPELKQEPIEDVRQNQPPAVLSEDSSSPTLKRKRFCVEENQTGQTPFCGAPISPSGMISQEQRGSPSEPLHSPQIVPSPPPFCSSEREYVLVSHLVTVYQYTPQHSKRLLEMYNWDLEAVIVALGNERTPTHPVKPSGSS